MAAPVLASQSAFVAVSAATLTLDKPTGTVSGDDLYAILTAKQSVQPGLPSGWTVVQDPNSTNTRLTVAHKKAGGSEPATYDFTGATNVIGGRIVRVTGAHASSPNNASSQNTGNGNTATALSVTPSVADCLVLFAIGDSLARMHSAYSGTNPTFAENFDDTSILGSDMSVVLASGSTTSTSALGDRTATISSTAVDWATVLLAIAPVAAGGTTITRQMLQFHG